VLALADQALVELAGEQVMLVDGQLVAVVGIGPIGLLAQDRANLYMGCAFEGDLSLHGLLGYCFALVQKYFDTSPIQPPSPVRLAINRSAIGPGNSTSM